MSVVVSERWLRDLMRGVTERDHPGKGALDFSVFIGQFGYT
jgi:hypothetical protein